MCKSEVNVCCAMCVERAAFLYCCRRPFNSRQYPVCQRHAKTLREKAEKHWFARVDLIPLAKNDSAKVTEARLELLEGETKSIRTRMMGVNVAAATIVAVAAIGYFGFQEIIKTTALDHLKEQSKSVMSGHARGVIQDVLVDLPRRLAGSVGDSAQIEMTRPGEDSYRLTSRNGRIDGVKKAPSGSSNSPQTQGTSLNVYKFPEKDEEYARLLEFRLTTIPTQATHLLVSVDFGNNAKYTSYLDGSVRLRVDGIEATTGKPVVLHFRDESKVGSWGIVPQLIRVPIPATDGLLLILRKRDAYRSITLHVEADLDVNIDKFNGLEYLGDHQGYRNAGNDVALSDGHTAKIGTITVLRWIAEPESISLDPSNFSSKE